MYNQSVATSIVHNSGVSISRIGPGERDQIDSLVAQAERDLKPEVVRIRYDLGEDSSGDSAIYFRVLLTDKAAEGAQLRRTTARAFKTILKHVSPADLGLQWYFNYRSASEQAALRERSWS